MLGICLIICSLVGLIFFGISSKPGISAFVRFSSLFFSFEFSPIFAQMSSILEPGVLLELSDELVPFERSWFLRIVVFIMERGMASGQGGIESDLGSGFGVLMVVEVIGEEVTDLTFTVFDEAVELTTVVIVRTLLDELIE